MEQNRSRPRGWSGRTPRCPRPKSPCTGRSRTTSPRQEFVAQATLPTRNVFKRSLEKFPGYYREFAELLDWYKKWTRSSMAASRLSALSSAKN